MGKESNARTTLIKVVVTCLVVALSFCIIFLGEYTIGSDEDTAEPAATADMNFTPGTYTATAPGMESDVEVTAVFDEDSIMDVSVDVSGETAGIGAEIGDEMTQQFLAAQSASVDGVSGASVTSGALMDAMQDCIDQAAGGGSAEAAETEEETEAAEEVAAENEEVTEAAAEEAAGEPEGLAVIKDAEEPEAAGEAAEPEPAAEEKSEETAAEEAGQPAAEEETAAVEGAEEADTGSSAEGGYIPGTYSATVEGAQGEISVSVTFTENAIVAVSSDLSGETEDIGAVIGPEISKQILDAQSAEVDGVSGATVTSDAVKEAVKDCIAQASAGSTSEQSAGEEEPAAVEEAAGADAGSAAEGGYIPGTYSATVEGAQGEISVSVTFTENAIVAVSSDLSGETEDIGAVIGPEISKQILDAQSAEVDGVSGATVTSDAVKEAVKDCIAQASAGSTSEQPADEEEAAAAEEAAGTTEDSSEGGYTPGSYSAEAEGMSSTVTVSLQFSEDSILSASCDVSGETEDIGAVIGTEICTQILDAQSADIDGVSGATVTSHAVKEAAAECIAKARGEE